jgi:hypothetical protein
MMVVNWHGRLGLAVQGSLQADDVCHGGDLGTRIGTQNMPPSSAATSGDQRTSPLWTQAMTVQNFVAIYSRNVVKPVQIAASLKKIFALQVASEC